MNNIMDDMIKVADDISVETKKAREIENNLMLIISELEYILRFCRNAKRELGKNPADRNLLELIECLVHTIDIT